MKDLEKSKEILQNLNETIGVYALIDYTGFNKEHIEHFGDIFIFQCEKDKFLKYCKENNIKPKKEEGWKVYTEIDGNIYYFIEE